jgi:hypothetical protein
MEPNSQDCRNRAAELRIEAATIDDPQARDAYESIIRTWLALADKKDARALGCCR